MLLPNDPDYDQRRYLADALRAFWHKVIFEKRSYWPTYTGIRLPWWEELRPVVAFLTYAGLFVGICWIVSR